MTIFPQAFLTFSAFFAGWALITMIYGSAMALVQDDIKRLLAYSSISQMGYILFGLAAFNSFGVSGSMFQYVSNGTAKGILFIVVGAVMLPLIALSIVTIILGIYPEPILGRLLSAARSIVGS